MSDNEVVTTEDTSTLAELTRELRDTAQCVKRFDVAQVDEIAQFRALGRKAGRELGWKVRTFQLDPEAPGQDVIVYVAVTESTPLHQELMRVRGDKAVRRALKSWPSM